jgi:hypothetical protein
MESTIQKPGRQNHQKDLPTPDWCEADGAFTATGGGSEDAGGMPSAVDNTT